jgi:4-hydroxybenzoate polyprenyltransferase
LVGPAIRLPGLAGQKAYAAVTQMIWKRLCLTLEMIKFEHSVFALPFALTGALLAFRQSGFHAGTVGSKLVWICLAMVGARSAAMAFNRLVDSAIDARNPRTKMRQLPTGVLSRGFTWSFVAASCVLFFVAAGALNPLCLRLAPLALAAVFLYSFTKRFTAFSHIVLGFCLGIAPAAAWIAVRGSLDPRILWLTAAVTFWTAGFDVIYSCQDYDFDCSEGLFSIPRRVGIAGALYVSRGLHLLMVICLLALVRSLHLGVLALAGVAAILVLLIYEHSLVKPHDLSRVNAAFFTMNGYVSVLFFLFWAADILLLKPSA